jgi:hypothetical protein
MIVNMRTTLDIDDDLLQTAKEIAARRGITAGQAVSGLLRKALAPPADSPQVRNGVPLFPAGQPVTMKLVNDLRDE